MGNLPELLDIFLCTIADGDLVKNVVKALSSDTAREALSAGFIKSELKNRFSEVRRNR